ncbi:3-hydroxyacyl-CoA dehydrogenase [Actinacidiphila bryophytorum]|uniref:3-hydroxyacyl-CoA dehydrogenase n=1 Tax=Actinacidiphila bryophytorum TaxID=1436133 RepID=UPI002176CCE5|nr:3-hydroxyacyl-CoA dehydrogenase [Actinacidiphila bryophytorum]UWE07330.1 3-hydroxyacyl-CoA dehydrogenase [Actinacidiphila bryophytorum]
MSALDRTSTVAVVGAGTMGQGIAQVALLAGHRVLLHDAAPGRAQAAADAVAGRLDRLVAKGRLGASDLKDAVARLVPAEGTADLAGAALVVEAVVEDLAVKQALFAELEAVVGDGCLLVTNTSSLPVTAVAGALRLPGRLVGLHFFNPAPLLPLVEVVAGAATSAEAVAAAYDTAAAWGKTPVRCTDTPGFVVNRIARPFYAEALRVYEERAADPATVDAVLRESGGFAMGPFELMDLIGQDVNEAVTRSVWEAFFHDPKFTPSLAQRRLVESGRLGRKSGRGWFGYPQDGKGGARPGGGGVQKPESLPHTAAPAVAPTSVVLRGDLGPARALPGLLRESGIEVREAAPDGPGALLLPGGVPLRLADGHPMPAPGVRFDLALDYRTATRVAVAPCDGVHADAVDQAVGLFQALGKDVSVVGEVPGLIVARTVAMLVDLAADAVARQVASARDIDTAMRRGVSYPLGPLEWCEQISATYVRDLLEALHRDSPTGRYAPCRELRRRADAEGGVVSS